MPRLGRRATAKGREEPKPDDDLLESPGLSVTSVPVAPPRTRKTGWADDGKNLGSKSASTGLPETERIQAENGSREGEDIPVIPDLDEIQEEDSAPTDPVAAPFFQGTRTSAYKDLDADLPAGNVSFATFEGIDLRILTEKLYSEKTVVEPDQVWSWDSLLTQVSSEINSESQKKPEFA